MNKKFMVLSFSIMAFFLIGIMVIGYNPAVAQAKAKILRLVVATPAGDWPLTYMSKELADRFNKRAGGQYVIEVHAGGALAKLPEFFDAVRVGAVEMEFSNWGMFSFLDPRLGLLETPFLFNNNSATSAAVKRMLPLFDDILMKKFNAKGLAMMSTGGLGLWSQKPVRTLDDIKGMLIASVSPQTSIMLKDLGGSPVTIVFTDIYESLQKKVVDGAAQSAHGGVVFSFPDVCKYFTAFFGMPAPAGYTINLDVWNKMPASIQKILVEEAQHAGEWLDKVIATELPEKDLNTFKKKKVSIYYMPKDERAKWKKKLEPYMESQFEKFGDLGQKLKRISDEENKKHPYKPDNGIM